jgi:hypothetical protein
LRLLFDSIIIWIVLFYYIITILINLKNHRYDFSQVYFSKPFEFWKLNLLLLNIWQPTWWAKYFDLIMSRWFQLLIYTRNLVTIKFKWFVISANDKTKWLITIIFFLTALAFHKNLRWSRSLSMDSRELWRKLPIPFGIVISIQ